MTNGSQKETDVKKKEAVKETIESATTAEDHETKEKR